MEINEFRNKIVRKSWTLCKYYENGVLKADIKVINIILWFPFNSIYFSH